MDEEVKEAAVEYLEAEVQPLLVQKIISSQEGIYCWDCQEKVFYNKQEEEFYCPVCDNANTT